jgi:hypothetical protein
MFNSGDTFAKVNNSYDGADQINNYLLGNVNVGGIEFGMILPDFFARYGKARRIDLIGEKDNDGNLINGGVLQNMIFGAKFGMENLEVAAQLALDRLGVYFGGKYFLGPATVGLSFMGRLNDPKVKHIKAGANFYYWGGSYGAGVSGKLENTTNVDTDTGNTLISVEPEFYIAAIASHLAFKLNAGFYFNTPFDASGKQSMDTYWGIQPALWYNFAGTGATDNWWGGFNTGMVVRYRIFQAKPALSNTNAMDVIFKFTMQ